MFWKKNSDSKNKYENIFSEVKNKCNFSKIIPCHFGTFPIIDESADKFLSAMEEDQSKVTTLLIGEKITL